MELGECNTDTQRTIPEIEPSAGGRKASVRFQLPDGCPTLSSIFTNEEIVQSIKVGDTIHLSKLGEDIWRGSLFVSLTADSF